MKLSEYLHRSANLQARFSKRTGPLHHTCSFVKPLAEREHNSDAMMASTCSFTSFGSPPLLGRPPPLPNSTAWLPHGGRLEFKDVTGIMLALPRSETAPR